MEKKNNANLVIKMQTLLQGILSLSAIIYFIGFLIVNSHYSTFGITHYQLVQTRYISAGLNFALIHVCLAILLVVILYVLEITKRIISWILSLIFTWAILGTTSYLFSKSMVNVILVVLNAGTVILLAYQISLVWTGTSNKLFEYLVASGNVQTQLQTSFFGVVIAILLCISSISWGLSYWPYMSSTLGGGRPSEAVFVFDENALPVNGIPLIPMQSTTMSEQIPLLFEDNDGFVVIARAALSEIAIRLPKPLVKSIIYAPAELAGKKQTLPDFFP